MENKTAKIPVNVLRQVINTPRNTGGLVLGIRHKSTGKLQIVATDVCRKSGGRA